MGRTNSNSNGDRSREETSRLEYFTKVVQLRTAYVVLAGVVLTTLTT
jgi:hypothetical protein